MTNRDDRSTRPPVPPAPNAPAERRHASLLQVAGAVFWSFFGVRKGRHMQQDMTIKPLHVVVVGLLSGLVFVLALLALVTFITRNAP
jgi:drug/metabolite transporter (DMT)-like permease